MRQRDRGKQSQWWAGFTLIELVIVIAIIGIIISLVLVASADGLRRAEERATQALITKLTEGYNDRLDALLNIQGPINQTHRFLAAICFADPQGGKVIPVDALSTNTRTDSLGRRAQVIAQTDYLRGELPDVFFLNAQTSDGATIAIDYPFNFAAPAYPTQSTVTAYDPYLLPLGNTSPGLPYYNSLSTPFDINSPASYILTQNPPSTQNSNMASGVYLPAHSGIFGASFSAIGALTKNLGYGPKGYDGLDNNGNGLIDEMAEGGVTPAQVNAQLANHTHKTARAEMLYAILVNGIGPLGSVFNAEDFTAREVQDTDNDGLPEFVDAWGEPLQFYRWPLYYGTVPGSSDSQRGSNPYAGFSNYRELDPLDPNQTLLSPGWFANNAVCNAGFASNTQGFTPSFTAPDGSTPASFSQGALAFMHYFHSLVDTRPDDTTKPSTGYAWDRTGLYPRRAYFSKVLILSGGPDKELGVGQFGRDYPSLTGDTSMTTAPFPVTTAKMEANALQLIFIENQAAQSNPYGRSGPFSQIPDELTSTGASATTTFLQTNAGLDDISNHNIATPGTGVR